MDAVGSKDPPGVLRIFSDSMDFVGFYGFDGFLSRVHGFWNSMASKIPRMKGVLVVVGILRIRLSTPSDLNPLPSPPKSWSPPLPKKCQSEAPLLPKCL